MKHWINKNYKTLIISAFLVPIITVAIVSISHVTKWYGISNPVSWAVYLSIGIEIAALSALAAISADMGKKVYFPFAIVTLVQFIGNIFFAYSFIDINSQSFKDWVDLVAPLLEFMGVEPTDFVGHKRFLALFSGGMLPIISLSFLHMLVKFTEEDRLKESVNETVDEKIQNNVVNADLADEALRLKLTERDLEILERYLSNPPEPNEVLKEAAKRYMEKMEKATIASDEQDEVKEYPSKEKQAELLAEMVKNDEELGLYDMDWGGVTNQELIGDELPVNTEPITPALSDEEVREMFMDEWERKFDMVDEEEPIERNFYVDDEMQVHEVAPEEYTPSQEEEELNFNNSVSEESVQDSGDFEEFIPEPIPVPEEAPKYNIDDSIPVEEEFQEINNDSFWRDHIQEEDDDLKKKS
jgi:hypothetical protein